MDALFDLGGRTDRQLGGSHHGSPRDPGWHRVRTANHRWVPAEGSARRRRWHRGSGGDAATPTESDHRQGCHSPKTLHNRSVIGHERGIDVVPHV